MNVTLASSEATLGPSFDPPSFDDEVVFLVEDDATLADGLHRFLQRSGFNVHTFTDPSEALAALDTSRPRVVVTDKEMPEMSGLELAERVLELDASARIILITGAGGEEVAQSALRMGAADYLIKPIELTELARSVQRSLTSYAADDYGRSMGAWLRDEVARHATRNREIMLGTLDSLVNALEARSAHFSGHSRSVSECAERIARAIGASDEDVHFIQAAGLLHDIGMIAVPDSVVQKPGPLDSDEMELIREHCRTGARILEPMTHLGSAVTYVLEHHERLDGSGYPEGKRGDEISLGGQIVGLAEAWTALLEERTYRDPMSYADARATFTAASGSWFAEDLVKALLRTEAR